MKKLLLVALTATTLISNLNAFTVTIDSKEIGTKLANATIGKLGNKVLPYYVKAGNFCLDKIQSNPANAAGAATLLGGAYVGYKVRNWWNSLDWWTQENIKRTTALIGAVSLHAAGVIYIAKKKF